MECARRVSHPSIKNDSSAIWRSRGRCRFKEQPRQLFESLGDSRRGCDLLAGQARVFPLDIGIRAKHEHQVYKSVEGGEGNIYRRFWYAMVLSARPRARVSRSRCRNRAFRSVLHKLLNKCIHEFVHPLVLVGFGSQNFVHPILRFLGFFL